MKMKICYFFCVKMRILGIIHRKMSPCSYSDLLQPELMVKLIDLEKKNMNRPAN